MDRSILFCTGIFPPQIGGPATYVLKMARKMTKEGTKNAILTYTDNSVQENYGLNLYSVKWGFFIFTYFRYFLAVLKIGRKYDILYIQGSFLEGLPAILANFFLKKRAVMRIGGIFSWEFSFSHGWTNDFTDNFLKNKQSFLPEIMKRVDRFTISRCDKIIANSNYTKKLLKLNKIDCSKVEIIYNSIDDPEFEKISKEDYKKSLGIIGNKIILSAGRFMPWKNFDKLIEFSKKLGSDFSVFIIGNGPEEKKLKSLILENGLENKVFILNKLPKNELYKMYQIADIFTLISSFEGLSHVLVESMQFNLPIIASNIEPNIEALGDYDKCKIIDISEKSFLRAVASIESIGSSNKDTLKRFNFENIYKKTINLLCAY